MRGLKVGLGLLGLLAGAALAHTPVEWGGPGYYVFTSPAEGPSQAIPIEGPFSSENACMARRAEWREAANKNGNGANSVFWCAYEEEPW